MSDGVLRGGSEKHKGRVRETFACEAFSGFSMLYAIATREDNLYNKYCTFVFSGFVKCTRKKEVPPHSNIYCIMVVWKQVGNGSAFNSTFVLLVS